MSGWLPKWRLPAADLMASMGDVSMDCFNEQLYEALHHWPTPWVVEGDVRHPDGTVNHRWVYCDATGAQQYFIDGRELFEMGQP